MWSEQFLVMNSKERESDRLPVTVNHEFKEHELQAAGRGFSVTRN
jgi:hypothetical protein